MIVVARDIWRLIGSSSAPWAPRKLRELPQSELPFKPADTLLVLTGAPSPNAWSRGGDAGRLVIGLASIPCSVNGPSGEVVAGGA